MNAKTSEVIRKKASEFIAVHGYDALDLAMLVEDGLPIEVVDRQARSKQQLLFSLLEEIMVELIDALQVSVLPIEDAKARLQAFIRLHIRFHATRSPEVLIATTELKNLDPSNYKKIVALRNLYEGHVRDVIQRGCDQKCFSVADVGVAAASLITMLTYSTRRQGEISDVSMEAFTTDMIELSLRLVGATEKPACIIIPFPTRS